MNKSSKIYITSSTGLVGSAILKKLKNEGHKNLIHFTHNDLDLTDKYATDTMFRLYNPQYVFLITEKNGGIHTTQGEHFYENIMIQTNVIEASRKYGVKKLLYLGSSSIYPKESEQPIKEEFLMSGPLELTNSSYALTKIAGIEMCKSYNKQWGCNFISAISSNLYGERDNFSLNSKVIPAFIYKFYEAKINNIPQIELFGDGNPKREFLHVDDLVNALYIIMNNYNDNHTHINVGSGYDVPIKFIAKMIKDIIGYNGKIIWNNSYHNGVMQKLMDISKIKSLNWEPKIDLEKGIKKTYEWFLENNNMK